MASTWVEQNMKSYFLLYEKLLILQFPTITKDFSYMKTQMLNDINQKDILQFLIYRVKLVVSLSRQLAYEIFL